MTNIFPFILQFITFGFACTPLYFVWEKVVGMHDTKSICLRALARLPVVIPIWFLAIIFPFFGPINSAVGALLVSFTVYIIPALAHMLTYRSASARQVNGPIFQLLIFNLYLRATHCLISRATANFLIFDWDCNCTKNICLISPIVLLICFRPHNVGQR